MLKIIGTGLLSILLLWGIAAAAEKPFPAHKILGNVYYVGSDALAIYLIATPEGDKKYDVVVIGSPNVNQGYRLVANKENPFIDPKGYRAYVAEKEKAYLTKLADQRTQQARSINAALQPGATAAATAAHTPRIPTSTASTA